MTIYLETKVGELRSGDVLALVTELETASRVSCVLFMKMTLWHFLVQCVYPFGVAEKRQPISAKFLAEEGRLGTTLRKLAETDIFSLCEELAQRNHTSLEFSLGQKLAVFLNSNLPKYTPPKKLTALQQRRHNLVMQRRANRR